MHCAATGVLSGRGAADKLVDGNASATIGFRAWQQDNWTGDVVSLAFAVPEPAFAAMYGSGMLSLMGWTMRRRPQA